VEIEIVRLMEKAEFLVSTENIIYPSCKKVVVERSGFLILSNQMEGGKCKLCGAKINGIWS
jgi:hypothetical protein